MRTLVMGDVHGAYKAMIQCLERSNFNYEIDELIQLGDIVDGYPEVYECVEELLKIEHLIPLKGNHDDWFDDFIKTGLHPYYWNLGGKGTLISYLDHANKSGRLFPSRNGYKSGLEAKDIPESHQMFFNTQKLYYIDKNQRCFVHAGFDRSVPFFEQRNEDYYWDRSLWSDALLHTGDQEPFIINTSFNEIYLGHTPTTKWGSDKPLKRFNIQNLDTGAGHDGRLTIMDIDTKEFWQSDLMSNLYTENYR